MRDDHLGVGLGAESARLEQGLVVPDAAGVHVEAGLDVVDCIHDEVEAVPEAVIEDVLGLLSHVELVVLHIQLRVDLRGDLTSHLRLRLTHVVLPEEELPVQVGDLNVVIVGDCDLALLGASEAHEREGLDVFAAESAGADHECTDLGQLLLNLAAVDEDLVVVATAEGLPVDSLSVAREGIKYVEVEPLLEGGVLPSELNDLLCDHTTEEGRHG
jgi:hypothetical protein